VGCWGELEAVDAALSVAAVEEAALQLRLGQVLEVLGRSGRCGELGFSSISAYALERAERRARWVEGALGGRRALSGASARGAAPVASSRGVGAGVLEQGRIVDARG
jgi:hypothetical protein